MGKDSFVFYLDWIKHLSLLDPSEVMPVLNAIGTYIGSGTINPLTGAEAMAFSFIRAQIDRDMQKWEEVKKKRSEAGRAGAEVTNSKRQKSAKPANAEQTATKPAVPVPVPVTVPVPSKEGENQIKELPASIRFVPPTLEQVAEYVAERNSKVDPQGFIDFYASKGWRIGKTPMKDWKAACRNAEHWERWERNKSSGRAVQDDVDLSDIFGVG